MSASLLPASRFVTYAEVQPDWETIVSENVRHGSTLSSVERSGQDVKLDTPYNGETTIRIQPPPAFPTSFWLSTYSHFDEAEGCSVGDHSTVKITTSSSSTSSSSSSSITLSSTSPLQSVQQLTPHSLRIQASTSSSSSSSTSSSSDLLAPSSLDCTITAPTSTWTSLHGIPLAASNADPLKKIKKGPWGFIDDDDEYAVDDADDAVDGDKSREGAKQSSTSTSTSGNTKTNTNTSTSINTATTKQSSITEEKAAITKRAEAPASSIKGREGPRIPVLSLAINGIGQGISGSLNGSVRVWDATTGLPSRNLAEDGHVADVDVVRWFPSNVVALTAASDRMIKVWAVGPAKCALTLTGHERGITDVQMIGNGRTFVSASRDGTCRLWDTSRKSAVEVFGTVDEDDAVNAIALTDINTFIPSSSSPSCSSSSSGSSDGSSNLLLCATEAGTLVGYDLRSPHEALSIDLGDNALNAIAVPSEGGPVCFIGTQAGTVLGLDLRSTSSSSTSSSTSSPPSLPTLLNGDVDGDVVVNTGIQGCFATKFSANPIKKLRMSASPSSLSSSSSLSGYGGYGLWVANDSGNVLLWDWKASNSSSLASSSSLSAVSSSLSGLHGDVTCVAALSGLDVTPIADMVFTAPATTTNTTSSRSSSGGDDASSSGKDSKPRSLCTEFAWVASSDGVRRYEVQRALL